LPLSTRTSSYLTPRQVKNVWNAAVWVIERGAAAGGLHSHTLLHIPEDHLNDFIAMLPEWVDIEAGDLRGAEDNTIARSVLNDNGSAVWQLDERYDQSAKPLQYMLKGLKRGSAGFIRHQDSSGNIRKVPRKLYNINPKNAGMVTGKRIGFTNNLGPAARLRHQQERLAT
jgi:hypothetical protein